MAWRLPVMLVLFRFLLFLLIFQLPFKAAPPPLGDDQGTKDCRAAYAFWIRQNKKPTIGFFYDDPSYEFRSVLHEICPFYLKTGGLPSDLEQIRARHIEEAGKVRDKLHAQKRIVRAANDEVYLNRLALAKQRGVQINKSNDKFHYYSVSPTLDARNVIYEITINRSSITPLLRYDGLYDVTVALASTVNGQPGGTLRFRIYCKEDMNTAIDNSGKAISRPDRFWVSKSAARWACMR